MDDLIRSTIQEALAVEQPPAGLRARVIGSVPMDQKRPSAPRLRPLRFGAGFVAGILAVVIVAGLVYSGNNAGTQFGPGHQASGSRLSSPEGIAIAPDGTVYVSDFAANRVHTEEGRPRTPGLDGDERGPCFRRGLRRTNGYGPSASHSAAPSRITASPMHCALLTRSW